MSLASQFLNTAVMHHQSGQLAEAEAAYRQVLVVEPKNYDALHMLGVIAAQTERANDAIALFERAGQVKKSDPLLHYHWGLALQKQGKADDALLKYKKAASLKSDYAEAHFKAATIFQARGALDLAATKYRQAINAQKNYVEARYGLAGILYEQGDLPGAAEEYEKCIALEPDLAEAYNNLGTVLKVQNKKDEAVVLYRKALSLKPDFAGAYYNLGTALQAQGNMADAVAAYKQALVLAPHLATAHYNLALVLQEQGDLEPAIAHLEEALRLDPDNPNTLSQLVHRLQQACAWGRIGDREEKMIAMVRAGKPGVFPFMLLNTAATAADQLLCARTFSRKDEVPPEAMFKHVPGRQGDRIRIGYLSSDFHEHATAYLIAELFERHDRARFEVTGYSYGPDDDSPMRKRLAQAFEHFVDMREMTDAQAAQKIYDDEIDILVDLKGGFTGSARIGIPAYRPAPIQVNYLGYPGTMGVSSMDYILGDPFITPLDQQEFYSEKIFQLPDCYQPNDTQRKIAETPTRAACGLPDKGFVFCSFNASYKVTPQVFDIWMRLLQAVPGSVLWILESNTWVQDNLRREAAARGVAPERLVFAPRMKLPEHLARQRLADLFLDTLPINAHTTASDSLWVGLPLVTCAGNTFAGRVAGSLLTAVGLSELIAHSLADYESLALQLAQNPALLRGIRQKLESARLQVPLFDIQRFTRNIESAFEKMWRAWNEGKKQ